MNQASLETTDRTVMGEDGAKSGSWTRYAPLSVIAAGLALGYMLDLQRFLSLDYLAESREALTMMVAAHPVSSVAAFMAVYALAVAFSFPAASVLTIFGGFLFGWLVAGAAVAVAATAGATALFLAARNAFGDVLRRKAGGWVTKFADGFDNDAFGYLLFLRLAPVFPFFAVNIAPAFFKVSLRTYVAATFFGILPGCFAYAWLGQGIGSVLEAADDNGGSLSAGDLVTTDITIAFAALALVALIPIIARKVRARRG